MHKVLTSVSDRHTSHLLYTKPDKRMSFVVCRAFSTLASTFAGTHVCQDRKAATKSSFLLTLCKACLPQRHSLVPSLIEHCLHASRFHLLHLWLVQRSRKCLLGIRIPVHFEPIDPECTMAFHDLLLSSRHPQLSQHIELMRAGQTWVIPCQLHCSEQIL